MTCTKGADTEAEALLFDVDTKLLLLFANVVGELEVVVDCICCDIAEDILFLIDDDSWTYLEAIFILFIIVIDHIYDYINFFN